MVSARESQKRVLSSPKLILLGAVFGLLYSFIDNYNPLPGIIMGFSGLGGDFLGTVLAAISAFLSPRTFFKGLLYLIALIVAVSLVLGFYMSGYMSLIRSVIFKGNKGKRTFIEGIKRDCGRSVKCSIILFISSLMLLIVSVIALLPALTTMWAAFNGKSEMLPIALFITALSLFAVFFILLFYNVYAAYWFPAISMGYIRFIKVSGRVLDDHFFEVSGKILKFTMEFLLITLFFILIRYFFSGVLQNFAGFIALLAIEGSLITVWFLRITNYVTFTFTRLAEKY